MTEIAANVGGYIAAQIELWLDLTVQLWFLIT